FRAPQKRVVPGHQLTFQRSDPKHLTKLNALGEMIPERGGVRLFCNGLFQLFDRLVVLQVVKVIKGDVVLRADGGPIEQHERADEPESKKPHPYSQCSCSSAQRACSATSGSWDWARRSSGSRNFSERAFPIAMATFRKNPLYRDRRIGESRKMARN